MRALILLLLPSLAFALSPRCPDFEKAAELLDTKKFVNVSKNSASAGTKEISLQFADINQAKEYAMNFPALRDWGFNRNTGPNMEAYVGRLEKSALHGKQTGFKMKNPAGDEAIIRLDWDPQKGAHYNISITRHTPQGKQSYRMALQFNCGELQCSETQVVKMAERIFR